MTRLASGSGAGRLGHVVEAHHGEVVVGVGVRVARRGAVVGQRRAERVAVGLVEGADRGADPDRPQSLPPRARPRSPSAARSTRRSARRTRPGTPRRPTTWTSTSARSGRGWTAMVRLAARRSRSAVLLEDLGGAPVEQVLRDVEVVLDDRDARRRRAPWIDQGARAAAATGSRTRRGAGRSARSGRVALLGIDTKLPSDAYWPAEAPTCQEASTTAAPASGPPPRPWPAARAATRSPR